MALFSLTNPGVQVAAAVTPWHTHGENIYLSIYLFNIPSYILMLLAFLVFRYFTIGDIIL